MERDLIDCIVSLPGQLFSTTQIPVCLWFVARDKSNGSIKDKKLRDRRVATLFIDARNLGTMKTRTLKELTVDDVAKIAETYHAWREKGNRYDDIAGFAKSVSKAEIAAQSHVLTPGRYVGTEARDADTEPFTEKMGRLTVILQKQMAKNAALVTVARIRSYLPRGDQLRGGSAPGRRRG